MVQFVQNVIEAIGYVGVGFLTFVENIFPPIPSEVVIPFAGFAAKRGDLTLWGVIVAGTAGTVLGALPLYYLGHKLGERRIMRFADRYGHWFTVSSDEIRRADEWLRRRGRVAVFICRLIPGLRSLISIPAGVAGMNLPLFLAYTTVGTLLWMALLAWLGYILGSNYSAIQPYMDAVGWVVFVGLALYAAWWVWQRRRQTA